MSRIKLFLWYVGVVVLSLFANITIKFIPFKSLIRWITNSEAISTEELYLTNNEQNAYTEQKSYWSVFVKKFRGGFIVLNKPLLH